MINSNKKVIKNQQVNAVTSLHLLLRNHLKLWAIYDLVAAYLAAEIFNFSLVECCFFSLFFLIANNILGLYEKNAFNSFIRLLLSLCVSTISAIFGLVLLKNIVLYDQTGRQVMLFIFFSLFFGCSVIRILLGYYIRRFALRILFVGSKEQATDFKKYFSKDCKHYIFVGYCDNNSESDELNLGSIENIKETCESQQVDLVVIDNDYIVETSLLEKCLQLIETNCAVVDKENFIEASFDQVALDKIDSAWFYRSNLGLHNNLQLCIKRLLDIAFAITGLAITASLYPFIWLAVKLTSPGPLVYSQIRCGRFGRKFKIYKFRSMRVDAEPNGAVWAKHKDNRVTKIGNILRKTRLDELPQFWNILIGDMAFVGPRPERPELVEKIEQEVPYFYFRHFVKPGITGFAQIRYRYGASIDDAKEKLKYDLYYVKNWSLFMDIQIILRTIVTIMKGAR